MPVCVELNDAHFVGSFMQMTLNLDLFIVVALMLSVIHANFVTSDATSHWLMGVALIAVRILSSYQMYHPSIIHHLPPPSCGSGVFSYRLGILFPVKLPIRTYFKCGLL
jgi:hypothetical protein